MAFLALPHGVAVQFAAPLLSAGARVIDLSADFRMKIAAVYREFYGHEHPAPELLPDAVYGLPEIHRDQIHEARLVACPGCYPTSILLPLMPLLRGKIDRAGRHHRQHFEWRQRGRPKSGARLSFCRMQRKRPALRRTETSSSVGDRAGTFQCRSDEAYDSIHAASRSGESRHSNYALSRADSVRRRESGSN